MAKKPWQKYGFPKPKSEASKGPLSLIDYEIYSGIELPKMPFFVRLDGWAFHALTKKLKFKSPFDRFLAQSLAKTAQEFFVMFNPVLAYIFSDEINFLFAKTTAFKRIEKIDSVFAGYASTHFYNFISKKYKIKPMSFDCRCIPLPKNKIVPYLIWRQAECFRNHNNSWAQHALMKKGLSARAASKKLHGMKTNELKKISKEQGIDLNKTPMWQRDGIIVKWEYYMKKGYDPIKKRGVTVQRRKPIIDLNPPLFGTKQGKEYLKKLIK